MSIVDKIAGENADGWRLIKQHDNRFWFCFGNGSNGCNVGAPTTVISVTTATTDRWYQHVAGVKFGTTISIYVNGILEGSTLMPSFVDINGTN